MTPMSGRSSSIADAQSSLTSATLSRAAAARAGSGERPHRATSTFAARRALTYPSPAQPQPITSARSILSTSREARGRATADLNSIMSVLNAAALGSFDCGQLALWGTQDLHADGDHVLLEFAHRSLKVVGRLVSLHRLLVRVDLIDDARERRVVNIVDYVDQGLGFDGSHGRNELLRKGVEAARRWSSSSSKRSKVPCTPDVIGA